MKSIKPRKKVPKYLSDLIKKIKKYGYVAGGAARYFALKKTPKFNDIDIFCKTLEDEPYISEILRNLGYTLDRETINSTIYKKKGTKIIAQIIKPFENEWMQTYGKPEVMVGQFDFTVVKAYFKSPNKILVGDDFTSHNKSKKLVIEHINCPIAVTTRVIKYCKKGYRINLSEIIKLFVEWESRDDDYRDNLLRLVEIENPSTNEIDEMERLLRID